MPRFKGTSITIWGLRIVLDMGRPLLVVIHHHILSLRLTRDGTSGENKTELETSSYTVKAYDVTKVARRQRIPMKFCHGSKSRKRRKRIPENCEEKAMIKHNKSLQEVQENGQRLCQKMGLSPSQIGPNYMPKQCPKKKNQTNIFHAHCSPTLFMHIVHPPALFI